MSNRVPAERKVMMVHELESKSLVEGEEPDQTPRPFDSHSGSVDCCEPPTPAGGVSRLPAPYGSGPRQLSTQRIP